MDPENAAEILFEVDDILKSLNIKYYLACGTALGFYRDGNFIPWDDEIDIEILSETFVPILKELREKFISSGFIARATYRGKTSKMPIFKKGVKVALCSVYDNGAGFHCDLNQKFPSKFYENPEEFTFKERKFTMPGPIADYLSFYYGDWQTVIKSYDVNEYLNKNRQWKK
tara:strand:- start:124 stop:636 length:513 start_codon:yes stop_codon:yes gene_type:complete